MTPLTGKRILITRPEHQAADLANRLIERGAVPVIFPTIAVKPDPLQQANLEQALRRLDQYDWLIFTSQNAVKFFWEQYEKARLPLEELRNLQVVAVGPSTARAAAMCGIAVDSIPDEYVSKAVASVMEELPGKRVLIPRAQAAQPELVEELTRKGALVNEIPLYKTVTNRPAPDAWRELNKGIDFFTFTSASTVHAFFELLGDRASMLLGKNITACIGPITASALEEYGITPQIIAESYTSEGLVKAMLAYTEKSLSEGIS